MLDIYLLSRQAIQTKTPVAWFAPTYKDLAEIFRDFKLRLGDAADANEQEKRIEIYGGGSIDFWSMDDPDSGRGRKYSRVFVDEAAKAAKFRHAWTQAIRPTLTDYGGDAWFGSTPKGLDFFWEIYEYGQSSHPDHQTWASWKMPTSANPTIPNLEREIEEARLTLPEEVFSQEYLAEFIEDSGAVFRRIKEAATATFQEQAKEFHVYHIGVDLAKSKDFTVISVIDCSTGELVYFDRFNQMDYLFQIDKLKVACEWFTPDVVTVEENSNEALIEMLRRSTYRDKRTGSDTNLPIRSFRTTNESKAGIVQALALAFERGEIRILNDRVLIQELLAFSKEKLPISGQTRYSAPEGLHDDCVMSLCLAWHTARNVIGEERLSTDARVQKRLVTKGFTQDNAPKDSTRPYWEMTRDIEAKKLYREESTPQRYGIGAMEDAFEKEEMGVPDWFE